MKKTVNKLVYTRLVKKKTIFGSIFVLIVIMLMPSIPAIQKNVIDNEFKQKIQEKIESIDINDLKYIKKLETIKFPIILAIVFLLYTFLESRGFFIQNYAWELLVNDRFPGNLFFLYELMILRGVLLVCSAQFFLIFWLFISNILGWNWSY